MSVTGIPFPKIEAVTFRELRPEETVKLMPFLQAEGWRLPYPYLASAVVGEYEGKIVSFAVLQLIPHVEPLWVQDDWRGSGLAEATAYQLIANLERRQISAYLAIAPNPFMERLCKKMGMKEIPGKVFVKE